VLLACVVVSTWLAAWAMEAQRVAGAALANERRAREEAVTAKEAAESHSKRLSTATELLSEGIDFYNKRNWAASYQRFNRAAEVEPKLRTIYVHRGMLYLYLGLWDLAAEDYERRSELATHANAQVLYEFALLKFYCGDQEGYRRACEQALRQHSGSRYLNDQLHVLRACLLSSEPAGDPADLVRRGEGLITSSYAPWNVAAAGLAHLRAGNHEQAAARLREAIERGSQSPGGVHAVNYVPLSIALYQLGEKTEAEQALAQAEKAIDGWTKSMCDGLLGAMPMNWWDWLECQVHYREAKTLISGEKPAIDPRLAARYERALGAITQGDAYTFMAAGRAHVRQKAWPQAASSFSNVLDQLPYGFRHSSEEMRMCVEMSLQPEVFQELIKLRPRDPRLWNARGHIYANQEKWAEAANDYAKTLEIRNQEWFQAGRSRAAGDWAAAGRGRTGVAFELAALHLLQGDEAGYRELCATIGQEQDDVDDPVSASFLSRAWMLSPAPTTDWSAAIRLAELSVKKEPRTAWFLFSLGAAQYRAGRYAEAVERLEESLRAHPAWVGRCQNHALLAMACHQLGREDAARQWLAKAKAGLDEMDKSRGKSRFGYATSDYMSDWLTMRVLLPEAEKLLEGDEE
jgi:tetratricopeptide (TPR) repeat protein